MTRALLPVYNETYGQGMEGLINWANQSTGNWMIPLFLFVFYGLALFLWSKTEWKLGGGIAFISFMFFILGMIAQTFTPFNQLIMFIFALGIPVGIVIAFIEK